MKLQKGDITKIQDKYKPKAMVFMCDELNELMSADDYKSVNAVKESLNAIARLGRAAGCHLVLACQRPSSNTINSELKNNIQLASLLGMFDSGASSLIFDEDISHRSKPEIKGRGFTKSGNDVIEYQSYYSEPENDYEFDESLRETFENPIFLEQCRRKGIENPQWQKPYWFKEETKKIKQEENINKSNSIEEKHKDGFINKDELDDDDIMAMFKGKADIPKPKQLDENTVETESIKNAKKDYTDDEIAMMFKIDKDDKPKENNDNNLDMNNPFASFRDNLENNKNEIKEDNINQQNVTPTNKFKINMKSNTNVQQTNKFKIHKKEE